MSRIPDLRLGNLEFFERPVDDSERRSGVVRRCELRDTMAIPPHHIKAGILTPSGDVQCSCHTDCAHLVPLRLYFKTEPSEPFRATA